MKGVTILYCVCLLKLVSGHLIFPEILENSLTKLRPKREATCGGDIRLDSNVKVKEVQLRTEVINGTEFYRREESCTWDIKTDVGNYLILSSEYFSLEDSDNCMWDYVVILEDADELVENKFCGWDPLMYITRSNEIRLTFISDVSYEDKGFKFIVESKPNVFDDSKCNSSIYGGQDSSITNRDDSDQGCFYRITAPNDKVINLNLKILNFGSSPCSQESLVIYEGPSTHGQKLAEICSDQVPGMLPFHVKEVFIEYRNPFEKEGERYRIEYSFVENTFTLAPTPSTTPSPVGGNNDCSGMFKDINTDSGEMIYTAPEYENDKDCIIVVRNTLLPGHVVQIKFVYFEIEESTECMFDSLRLLSGERNDSTPMGGPYCGESLHGRTFLTSGNSLRLEFKTDVSFALRGFKAKISFVPSKSCSCDGNTICVRKEFEKKCIRGRLCVANTCQNGGTCVQSGSSEACYCPAGFSGTDCSNEDGGSSHRLHFIIEPPNRALKRDESHTEECAVEIPEGETVQYFWILNGAQIDGFSSSAGFGTHPGGLLQIDKFTDRLEGQYSCVAVSETGSAEHTFEYRLVEDCDVRIYPGPQSESKKIGENALLICHVDHRAKNVYWMKNNIRIDTDNEPRFKQMVNNYLYITDVGLSDAGTYQCVAEDSQGCHSYKEGTLSVVDVQSLNKYCGISIFDEETLASSRISKGSDARPNENPWHVTIRSTPNVGKEVTFCGGTLISQRYVLTAAHCIREFEKNFHKPWSTDNVVLIFGSTSCFGSGENVIRRTYKTYNVHPDYNRLSHYDSDIAILELDSPVEYSISVRPICLEPDDYNDRVFLEHRDSLTPVPGKVTGCGKKGVHRGHATVLQVIHLPYVRKETCEESLERTKYRITDTMFCAGSDIARTGDTCGGDSGGGLVMATATKWVQTGIVSWAVGGCDASKYYGVYTNVGRFYEWIDGITKFSEEEVPDFLKQN